MSDAPTPPPASEDDRHIEAADELQLQEWAWRLGTTTERLRLAVGVVGSRVKAVRRWLAGHP